MATIEELLKELGEVRKEKSKPYRKIKTVALRNEIINEMVRDGEREIKIGDQILLHHPKAIYKRYKRTDGSY